MLKNKNNVKILIILLFYTMGCAPLKKEHAEKQYYDLNIAQNKTDRENGRTVSDQRPSLLVKELLMAPAFDSHAFIYRLRKDNYQADFYNEFIIYPAKLITDKIRESLYNSQHFSKSLNKHKEAINFRLSGKILNLYGDLITPNTPKAVIEIRFQLEKNSDDGFQSWLNQTYRSEINLPSAQPEDLAAGWSKGLTNIINQLNRDILPTLK